MPRKVGGTVLEALAIAVLGLILGVVYNSISEKGVPLIRQPRSLKWESDTLALALAKSDSAGVAAIDRSDTAYNREARSAPVGRALPPNAAEASTMPDARGEPLAIALAQAYALFQQGSALFVDARYEAEYRLGHIKGAMNLPYKGLEKYAEALKSIPKDTTIVTYCDGGECKLSIDLAFKLSDMGYRRVRIFYAGWTEWEGANYPIEKSSD